ncbi:hypothetical protein BH10PSE2_BH10PSE2_04270 [soil metagenome]
MDHRLHLAGLVFGAGLASAAHAAPPASPAPAASGAPGASGYSVLGRLPGPDGGWDYASYDRGRDRVLVARSTSIDVYDPVAASATAAFAPAVRGHAAIVVNDGAEILITNGGAATTTFVNADTGALIASVPTGEGPDAAILDERSGLVLVMDHRGGDVAVIDPKSHLDLGRITVGGALEAAVVDGLGHAFVNIEDQNSIAVIDIDKRTVTNHYALTGCEGPTGLAYAKRDDLLIASCEGVAEILRASTGEVIRSIPMGEGADGVAYDEERKLAFVPAGESGTLAVLRIADGDAELIDTIETRVGARTIALDPLTGHVFLPSADYSPAVDGGRLAMVPGSFRLLVVGSRTLPDRTPG